MEAMVGGCISNDHSSCNARPWGTKSSILKTVRVGRLLPYIILLLEIPRSHLRRHLRGWVQNSGKSLVSQLLGPLIGVGVPVLLRERIFRPGLIYYCSHGTRENKRLELRACMFKRRIQYTDCTSNGDGDKLIPGCKGEVDGGGGVDDRCSA